MISVIFNNSLERTIKEDDFGWVVEQIERRKNENQNICFRIRIIGPSIEMSLVTPGCDTSRRVVTRPNTNREDAVAKLWNEMIYSKPDFTGYDVVNFLEHSSIRDLL